MKWTRKHLLDIESLSADEITLVLDTARAFKAVGQRAIKKVPALRGKTRLAAHLLFLSERKKRSEELELDVSKNQLASLLGTIPETLSRILARMARERFIKASGQRRIQILDRKGLEELASGERRLP